MNELDSQRFAGHLKRRGLVPGSSAQGASLILLNTCSVREGAVHKLYSRLGELRQIKDENPSATIGVCGCVAQQQGEALFKRAPHVDFVIGTGSVDRLGEVLDEIGNGRDRIAALGFDEARSFDYALIQRDAPGRAMVTVIEGCNLRCTFCVVPVTRGMERSRPLLEVVAEVRQLVRDGRKEVQLLGQTVDAYRDPGSGADFSELLRAIATVSGLVRLSFVTSHPKYFSLRIIDAMIENPAITRYVHLPVQSGSDRILRRMNRQYTRTEYLQLVDRIRHAIPDVTLSGDVIVGFPGETEREFQETLSLVRDVQYSNLYAFKYSSRPDTAAPRLPGQIGEEVKSERLGRLQEVQDGVQWAQQQSLVGRRLEVLVDGPSRRGHGQLSGRSRCNRVVNFAAEGVSAGDLIDVVVTRAQLHSLIGSPAA